MYSVNFREIPELNESSFVENSFPGGAKPTGCAHGVGKGIGFFICRRKHRGDHKLSDPLTMANGLLLCPVIMKHYHKLPSIVTVDHANFIRRC